MGTSEKLVLSVTVRELDVFFEGGVSILCNRTHGCDLNDTHREKLCYIQFNKRMAGCLVLNLLICLHNQLSFIINSVITY